MTAPIALTARYRPQTFADVAGQATTKAILSRAAAENRVAAAYLFSGTRGVGKTTVARIFAKALNCRKGPAPEPCNTCDICRSVTGGMAVDVIEIDGASNRGIDDVRRLKEVVGYAPMEGRYKVFIIDEAHMLSRDAFNALLKTLEEPPGGVTFIMATTEPHKFPATIISRCQHFIFKSLPENELVDHLRRIISSENIAFEERAIRLIARRGAGSVRDSMSLLGQVLALGEADLSEATVRSVLGLAGQEAFVALLAAVQEGNTLSLVALLRSVLEQGLDIGFFLRELAGLWRNLFLLRQAGEAAFPAVDLPPEETRLLLEQSKKFSPAHIHACWQMTLEGQRRVQTSLEPGLALELLLLNLAMLPRLMPLDSLSALARKGGAASSTPPVGESPGNPTSPRPESQSGHGAGNPMASPAGNPIDSLAGSPIASPDGAAFSSPAAPGPEALPEALPEGVQEARPGVLPETVPDALPESLPGTVAGAIAEASPQREPDLAHGTGPEMAPQPPAPSAGPDSAHADQPTWNAIVLQAASQNPPPWFMGVANSVVGRWQEGTLQLAATGSVVAGPLLEGEGRLILESSLTALMGRVPPIAFAQAARQTSNRDALRERVYALPAVQALEKTLGAKIVDFGAIH